MSSITYRKTETVRIDLEEKEVVAAIRQYLGNRLDIPANADFTFDAGSDIFRGVQIQWTENPDAIVETLPG